jgi:hypothetical protein
MTPQTSATIPNTVILNLFHDPLDGTRGGMLVGAERAARDRAQRSRDQSMVAQWVLKQVQDDEVKKNEEGSGALRG